jgi:hypothetical protein
MKRILNSRIAREKDNYIERRVCARREDSPKCWEMKGREAGGAAHPIFLSKRYWKESAR